MFKEEIAKKLKTEYKSFGLSNEAIDRIASAKEKTVTEESQVETAVADAETLKLVAAELQKMRDSEIQKRTDLQREHDDYVAKHPETNPDDKGKQEPAGLTKEDISRLIADGIAAGIKPVQDAFDAYKNANSAKEAVVLAKEAFYANKWTGKFKEEADDAWERATELNDAKGGSMTKDELNQKATDYFNKAVQRKGTDATKPFEDGDGGGDGQADFSAIAKRLESEGKIPAEEK